MLWFHGPTAWRFLLEPRHWLNTQLQAGRHQRAGSTQALRTARHLRILTANSLYHSLINDTLGVPMASRFLLEPHQSEWGLLVYFNAATVPCLGGRRAANSILNGRMMFLSTRGQNSAGGGV